MQVLSEVSKPYIIESLSAPIGISHFWTFSGQQLDFKLEALEYLEETTGPAIKIRAQNLDIVVPASWHIMAVDRETSVVDSLPVAQCATHDHNILLFSPDDGTPKLVKVAAIDFIKKAAVFHPMVPKGSAMVHPTGPEKKHDRLYFYGIVIGPHDLYRWVGGKTLGDILT